MSGPELENILVVSGLNSFIRQNVAEAQKFLLSDTPRADIATAKTKLGADVTALIGYNCSVSAKQMAHLEKLIVEAVLSHPGTSEFPASVVAEIVNFAHSCSVTSR